MAYTFDFIGNDGSIDHFQLGLFADDLEALKQAELEVIDAPVVPDEVEGVRHSRNS